MAERVPLLDLFSGIGGFSFALREVARTVAYCDIDPLCQRVLANNMTRGRLDTAPIFGDVTTLKASMLPEQPVIVTAGSPCLDVSTSFPKGQGIEGGRSSLVHQVFRLADECPAIKCIVLENSNALRARGLGEIEANDTAASYPKGTILQELFRRGFTVSWSVFSAADVGAPHLRRRLYLMAIRDGWVPPVLSKRRLRFDWGHEPVPRVIPRTYTPRGLARYEVANRQARMFGNAVVPQCVAFAYRTLRKALLGQLVPAKSISRVAIRQVWVHADRQHFAVFMREPSGHPTVLADIRLKQADVHFHRTAWGTPYSSDLWYMYQVLTHRSSQVLANSIFYDWRTRAYLKQIGETDFEQLHKRWQINPEFVGWLMGFPRHYSALA
ncbi:g1078 [Coccomyxa elongata]